MLCREHACSGDEVRGNVAILYLGPVAHVRALLAALIWRIGVVLEGDTGYFRYLSLLFLSKARKWLLMVLLVQRERAFAHQGV